MIQDFKAMMIKVIKKPTKNYLPFIFSLLKKNKGGGFCAQEGTLRENINSTNNFKSYMNFTFILLPLMCIFVLYTKAFVGLKHIYF